MIEVEVVNVTFVETQIRAGAPPSPAMLPELPAIPGNGVGGVVAAVGSGSDTSLLGSSVIASTGGSGAYAERVAVDAGALVPVPDGVELREAVALLADGRTAILLVEAARLRRGETALVEAAAGGFGSLLVQLSRTAGAWVVGAARGERKQELIRELGAHRAIDYSDEGWSEAIRLELGGVDVAFDGVGGEVGRTAFELLRPGGRLVQYGMASGEFTAACEDEAAERGIELVRGLRPLSPEQAAELVDAALDQLRAGRLRPVIGQTFPLERAADAHAAIEARATLGKTLLLT